MVGIMDSANTSKPSTVSPIYSDTPRNANQPLLESSANHKEYMGLAISEDKEEDDMTESHLVIGISNDMNESHQKQRIIRNVVRKESDIELAPHTNTRAPTGGMITMIFFNCLNQMEN